MAIYNEQTNTSTNKAMRYIFLLMLFASCYTPNKAIKDARKALDNHPAHVLPIFRNAFPCIVTDADTIYQVHDTIIEIPCPTETKVDTIKGIIVQTKIVKVPVRVQLPGRIITKYIEDSSKLKELGLQIYRYEQDILEKDKRIEKLENKIERRNKLIWWLIIAFLISLGLNLIRLLK
jgi:hypothetical protein